MKLNSLLLFISLFITSSILGQQKLLVNPEAWQERLILEGNVEVIDTVFIPFQKDSIRRIRYMHYLVADYLQDTVFYYEIFKSENPQRYLKSNYKFTFENETLRFYNKRDYLNFPKMGKFLFLCKNEEVKAKNKLHFATRQISSDSVEHFSNRDSSIFPTLISFRDKNEYFYQIEDSVVAKEHWVFIHTKVKSSHEQLLGYDGPRIMSPVNTQPVYINRERNTYFKAKLNRKTGLYDIIEILDKKEEGRNFEWKITRRDKIKTIKSLYKKIDKLPEDILQQVNLISKR